MNSDKDIPRLLGIMFIVVFVTSAAGGSALLRSRIWSGSASDNLVTIAGSPGLMRVNILGDLVTSVGIVVLAALLYAVLHKQNKIVALVALGWWLAEAITLAVSRIFALSLWDLGRAFVEAGTPDSAFFQILGRSYFEAADFGYVIHMLFFCLGAILWYSLFYQSKYVPRAISIWGIAAVSLVLIDILLRLYDHQFGGVFWLLVPYIPYEPFIGGWLIVKGIRSPEIASASEQ